MLKFTKWVIKSVLFLTEFFLVTGCGTGYEQKNGKTFFNGKEITDPHFVVLNEVFAKDSLNGNFAKDDLQVYFNDKPVNGSNGKNFRVLNEIYAADTEHIYYYYQHLHNGQGIALLPRNRPSFVVL